jgi:hypothetical protein
MTLTLVLVEVVLVVPQLRELVVLVLVDIYTALLFGFLGLTEGFLFQTLGLHGLKL